MTGKEIFTRYLKKFGNKIPTFDNTEYWDSLNKGLFWIRDNIHDEQYNDLTERYVRAIFEVATIEHEMLKRGGAIFDKL